MKITTRLKLAELLCLAVALIIGAMLVATTLQMRHELRKNEAAGSILQAVTSLRYLSLEYALRHESRTHAQWRLRKDSLQQELEAAHVFEEGAEVGIQRGLESQLEGVARHFDELLSIQRELQGAPERRDVLNELESRVHGQIANKTQNMIADAEELAERSRAGVLAAQRAANLVTLAFGGLLSAIVVGSIVMTIRSVAKPLERLRQGTIVVGAGQLDFSLGLTTDDEIGDLARAFDGMTERLRQTTVSRDDLAQANAALQAEAGVRRQAEQKVTAQLVRLNLLHQITRSIGERQDLRSIFQVLVRSLEDQLPADFGCVCLYDKEQRELIVSSVGLRSEALSTSLAMTETSHVPIDENGLSRCLRGELVYEPDITHATFPFPKRLAQGALSSLVLAPLLVDNTVFGVLVVARHAVHSFSSGECEFLRQLSEHVGLAAKQAQLYGDLQKAYDDLRQTQQSVTQQERLRALGQMASGIAHDINNAISPVALATESLLETERNLSPNGRNCLQIIERAIDDVAATVARMREFYRQREPQLSLSTVNVNTLIPHVVDLTRARWSDMPQQRGVVIEMRKELEAGLPAILGVDGEIREALTNLIFNAVDAMPEGGTLTLRTRSVAAAPGQDSGQVLLEVSDTGIGMDEATQRRCLEPFFTTKGDRGTGLGLAGVYGMVERHGGKIAIESAPQRGTTVRLSFRSPLAPPPAPVVADPNSAPPHFRILVVDDDPTVLASVRDILLRDGHDVVAADGGQKGIELFTAAQGSDAPFVLVITDLGMPYVDGRRVAEAIKNLAPATPVLLLTGWGQRLIPDSDANPVNVDYVLSKPPKLRELREVLSKIAAGHPSPA
ncbi:ATP-binding protein [Massilia sp. MB5]|uniref:ATP-binding protein n=1 Tax=Massilia sp. MB5 TaxID=2919578 RepID=UPI001F0E8202|nr:ATP-binding protein [Massilia sp. MB5]UMR29344.1 ATP-binding protein [Massilia sp. MB5]